ncbi:MAG TPA: hypothetical protein VHC69_10025 [Polyangiaceae bacterium]|nr:hypothetical protein [Polyangiaceae bacterium]
MSTATAWVKPAPVVTGQDHLGTQAPCVSIFTDLLPGITNVTSRARYYSFYPWFLWSYGRRASASDTEKLQMALRRAECLFALIGARHGVVREEHPDLHGAAMVGRDVLVPALEALAPRDRLRLSTHATLDKGNARYFLNPLGGLGQYYFGPLRDSGILGGDTRTGQLKFTPERGAPLAEAFDTGNDADAFFKVLEKDVCTLADLDALASFCPCRLKDNAVEQAALIEFFIDRTGEQGAEALPRRMTLGLMLDLIEGGQRREDTSFESEFRASVYAGAFADGSTWVLPDAMNLVRRAWGVYQRNELLSVVAQTLFWVTLETAIASKRTQAPSSSALADLLLTSPAGRALPLTSGETFASHVERARREFPPLSHWNDEGHEMQAAWRVLDVARERSPEPTVALDAAVRVLLALVVRGAESDPYDGCRFDVGYFDRYPINLRSVLARATTSWRAMSLEQVLREFTTWTIETHFRVAMQKLAAFPPRDTFKVRPFDGELRVVDAPGPSFTIPRVQRAVGILHDLDLVAYDDDARPYLKPLGKTLLGEIRG